MAGDRVWRQMLVRVVPHTSVSGEQWQRIGYGVATSNGAADGTTVISTGFVSGGADTYNGRYWVEMVSGTCKGQWKRIVDDDGSGTYTLENNGFSAQIDGSDEFAIWLSPEPVIVVDSSGAATTIVDGVRTEADDYWNDAYVMPITGNRRGEIQQISDFVGATGTFTVGAFTGVLAAGDVCLLGRFFEASIGGLPGGPDYIPRAMNRVNYSTAAGTVGARGADFSMTIRPHGVGLSGSTAARSDMFALLSAAGLEERRPAGVTVGIGSTTTSVAVNDYSGFQAGDFVSYQGNMRRITAMTDASPDTVTVAPPLPSAPVNATALYGIATYHKSADAASLYGCTIEVEIDGVRTVMTGCKGNLDVTFGTPIEFSFAFNADHWVREYEDAPYNPGTAYTTRSDILGKDMMAWADTTRIDIKGLTATAGREVSARAVSGKFGANGRAGFHHTNYACGATYQEISADGAELEAENRYLSGTDRALFVQCGADENSIALSIPVAHHVGPAVPVDGDGLMDVPNVLGALDAGTYTDPADTITKVPDWILAIA